VALALIRMLSHGEPIADHDLAAELGVPEAPIRDAVRSWPGVFRDERDRIIGFMGLSAREFGDHRIEVDGRVLTAWCAWDMLFLPALLGQTAQVSSRCPTTGQQISTTVTANRPVDVRPVEAVLSFLPPERPFDAEVMESFCHFVHFFASERAAHKWTAHHPGTLILSIDDGYRLGRQTNETTFGHALSTQP
jgi:alkylmercury lyase